MSHDRGSRILAMLFLVNLFIITWAELKPGNSNPSPIGWPRPARYLALGIAFTVLAGFGEIASTELAAVIGAGLTIGLIIQTVQTGSNTQSVPPSGGVTSTAQPTSPVTGTLQV